MYRLLTEVGTSIGASAVMVIAILIGGQILMTPTTSAATGAEQAASASCTTQPLLLTREASLQASARLCLTRDDARPTVQLSGLLTNTIYSAWIAYLERPLTAQLGRCASAQLAARPDSPTPGRIATGIGGQDGRVTLSATLPEFHLEGNSEVEILVVGHGVSAGAWTSTRTRQLITWDRTWSGLPSAAPVPLQQASSYLVGCASFWIRGGAEQAEH